MRFVMDKHGECVQVIDKTMRKMGIKYSFFAGSVLGLLREGKCLPYDPDIDIVIGTEHRPRTEEIIKELGMQTLSESRYLDRLECVGLQYGDGLDWVELDFLHTRGEWVWHPAIISEGVIPYVLPKRMWDNLEYIEAYGVKCPVFSPVEEYVEMMYGYDWRTPNPRYYQEELFRETPARRYDWDLTED